MNWLKKWLGIEDIIAAINLLSAKQESDATDLQEQISDIWLEIQGVDIPELPADIWDRKSPMAEWPKEMAGIKVGYIQIGEDKSPLHELDNKNVPIVYEDDNLRENNTTDAKRIIAKKGTWIMVVAKGDDYHFGDPRPFNDGIDGTMPWYKVMHEQIIDGINLTEAGLPEVFIRLDHVETKMMN